MLSQISLAQLACRASNLAERIFLLKQMSPPQNSQPLTLRDLQTVQHDLERLFPADPAPDSLYRLKRRAIRLSLRLFCWYEQNLAALSTTQQQTFLAVHSPWIQTYDQAITAYSSQSSQSQNATERLFRAGRPAASAPFLELIEVELRKIFDEQSPQALVVPSPSRLIAAVQQFFSQRIALMATQPGQHLEQRSANAEDTAQACHTFFLYQPVPGRWLAQVCTDTIEFIKVAVTRLFKDRCALAQQLWAGDLPRKITQIKLGQDTIQGRWNATFSLQLDSGAAQQICYYPYALEAERALQTLWVEIDPGQLSAADPDAVLCCEGYGYVRVSASAKKNSPETLRRLGQRSALRKLMGQQDLWSQIQIGIWRGDTVHPAEESFQAGVESVQRWLDQPSLAVQTLKTCFHTASVQLCHRSPAAYLLLLVTAQQRFLLTNPLAIDAIFQILVKQPCAWDSAGEIAQLEVKMLWQFKAPCLGVLMDRRYMIYDQDHVIFSKLPVTPLEFLTHTILQRANLRQSDLAEPQLLSAVF